MLCLPLSVVSNIYSFITIPVDLNELKSKIRKDNTIYFNKKNEANKYSYLGRYIFNISLSANEGFFNKDKVLSILDENIENNFYTRFMSDLKIKNQNNKYV